MSLNEEGTPVPDLGTLVNYSKVQLHHHCKKYHVSSNPKTQESKVFLEIVKAFEQYCEIIDTGR